jgi:hypothetical protein
LDVSKSSKIGTHLMPCPSTGPKSFLPVQIFEPVKKFDCI